MLQSIAAGESRWQKLEAAPHITPIVKTRGQEMNACTLASSQCGSSNTLQNPQPKEWYHTVG